MPLDIGSLSATGATLFLPGTLRSELLPAASTDAGVVRATPTRVMRHGWLREAR